MSANELKQKKRHRFVSLCGRIFRDIDPAYYPRAQYRGRTIYLCTESCLGAFLADPDLFYKVHRNSEKDQKMWKPGEVVAWRGIYRERVWHVQPTILVKDSPQEVVLTLLPGTECLAEESYPHGKENAKRWWDFKDSDWRMAPYTWHTNRFLLIFEPEKFYSTILFWNHQSDQFLCYYINFQLPFARNEYAVDTRDLELDIVIRPDLSYEWKDLDDYQKAIEHGLLTPELIQGIEEAKPEIFHRLDNRLYPFDGSWLDWRPDPAWQPPKLPENWDKI